MKKISETIVFFGSGPVAAEALQLLAQDFEIEAIITKPTTLGEMRTATPGTPIHAVSNKKELDALIETKTLKSRLGVLIDFGIIVPQSVIDHFPLGIVNSHFSILPEWRGADPITFSILSGQRITGISLMLLVEKMDEGPILAQSTYELPPTITSPELTRDLIELSSEALRTVLPLYVIGEVQPAPQEEVTMAANKEPTYSRKLTKDDGIIDWHKPAEQIEREIRAYLGWPNSRTKLAGKEIIVTKAHVEPDEPDTTPGNITVAENKVLMIQTGRGALCIERLKPAGKNEMTAAAFIAGHKHLLK